MHDPGLTRSVCAEHSETKIVDKLDQKTKLITEGSIVRSLFVIAWPIVLGNTMQTAYQLIDTFWVGRLGANAVAAVSVCFPLIFILLAFGFGLSIAASIFVSQYAGARKYDMVNHVAAQTLMMIILVAIVLSYLGYVSSPYVLRMIGVGNDILGDANRYLQISYIGMIFSYGFVVFQSILRGIGEVRYPLYVVTLSVMLNAIFDPLFIFGWGPVPALGVAGAAYSTIATQFIGTAIGVYVLYKGTFGVQLKLPDFVPDFPMIKHAIRVALPASLEQSVRTLGSIMLVFLATGFGTMALATFGIGMRIMSFIFIPAFGLGMATTTLVGQNIGAGNVDRAVRAARLSGWVGFFALTTFALLFYIFAAPLIRFFVPGNEQLINAGAVFIRIAGLSFGFIGGQQCLLGAFRGAGSTKSAMLISIITQWVFQFPISYVLCRHTALGVIGIWWGFPVANSISIVITIFWFKFGTWKKINLTRQEEVREHLEEEILIEEHLQQ